MELIKTVSIIVLVFSMSAVAQQEIVPKSKITYNQSQKDYNQDTLMGIKKLDVFVQGEILEVERFNDIPQTQKSVKMDALTEENAPQVKIVQGELIPVENFLESAVNVKKASQTSDTLESRIRDQHREGELIAIP